MVTIMHMHKKESVVIILSTIEKNLQQKIQRLKSDQDILNKGQ